MRRRRRRHRSVQYAAKPTALAVDFEVSSERVWIAYVRAEDLIRRNSHLRHLRVHY